MPCDACEKPLPLDTLGARPTRANRRIAEVIEDEARAVHALEHALKNCEIRPTNAEVERETMTSESMQIDDEVLR